MGRTILGPWRRVAVAGAMMTLFAACDDAGGLGQMFSGRTEPQSASGQGATVLPPQRRTTELQEVERPDLFAVTAQGLWDGRPSLGGLWVAHPDVGEPERVRIRDTTTGREARGALFRRPVEMPGPPFQLSSEAALELGILPGAPVMLEVIALRESEQLVVAETPDTVEAAPSPSEVKPQARPVALGGRASAGVSAPLVEAETSPQPIDISPVVSAPTEPNVRVGVYSARQKADAAAAAIRTAGFAAMVREAEAGGQTVWELVAGPAPLSAITELGFVDAVALEAN